MKLFSDPVTRSVVLAVAASATVLTLTSCTAPEKASTGDTALAAELAALRTQVAYLNDRQQIHDVYLHYMRGFDRNDVELMRTAFWPDVQINYGRQSNTFDEFVERHLKLHVAQLKSWGHLITNESVEIAGDIAHVEAYVTALWVPKDEKSFANNMPIVGVRYIDRFERRNGEWRIAVREAVPHFWSKIDTKGWASAMEALSKGNEALSDCAKGTWDKRDTSYRRPLERRVNKEVGPPCAE